MVPRPAPGCFDTALIPEFFAGRSVFITGATGFMGKVLVERLLWTCRDIQQLYLLMRPKKDVAPEKRLALLKMSPVFDVIRENCPQQLDKLSVVAGDVTQPALGLDGVGLNSLREVSVVIHSAATLKFDEPLVVAVAQNVRSVITVMDICDQLPNIEVFMHVSTAYSNADLNRVEERVYPMETSVQSVLALIDAAPAELLAEITPRLIHPKPNTYTFTKALAESAVEQRAARSAYRVGIFRPSIVVSSLRRPVAGWVDSLNGPSGVVASLGAGLLHVMLAARRARADMIPVDLAIDTLVAALWDTATADRRSGEVRVYNCSSYLNPTTWGMFCNTLLTHVREHPFNNLFWYPFGFITCNSLMYKVGETVFQTVPLTVAEYLFKLCCFKTRLSMSTASKRLIAINNAFKFFSTREWHFDTANVEALRHRLSPHDAQLYNLDTATIDWDEHCMNFVKGTKKYVLKEKDQDEGIARKRIFRLRLIHIAFICGLMFLLFSLVTQRTPTILWTTTTPSRPTIQQNTT